MTIVVEVAGAVIVVSVYGDVDIESAPRLGAELELVESDRSVVVDMAAVRFINTTGLCA